MSSLSRTFRSTAADSGIGIVLAVMAVSLYAGMFIHVPMLTEARDFLLRFGKDARLWQVFVPSGDDYRPFSWALFAWQQQLIGFHAEILNLMQFGLLGLCAFAAYIHLRQLLSRRFSAFGATALWVLSLPVAYSAFWQATQHDKLAFLFTILTLITTLAAIRSNRAVLPISFIATLFAAVAISTKPIAFLLPIALIAQVVLFAPAKTFGEYLRASRVIMLPSLYVAVYAGLYMLKITPEWRAHTLSGNIADNVLVYIRNVTNIDYDGNLTLALVLFAPVLAAWAYAFRHPADRTRGVLIYLFLIFAASLVLLAQAQHATAFYVLLPLFAFTGSLWAVAELLWESSRFSVRRLGTILLCGIVIGLIGTYWMTVGGPSRFSDLRQGAAHLAEGYGVMRRMVDPARITSIAFRYPSEPSKSFYFFSDGTHQIIDPLLPSFIFSRSLEIPIKDAQAKGASADVDGELTAVWSDDLRLMRMTASGTTIYHDASAPAESFTYRPGSTLEFHKGGNGEPFRGAGWSWPEPWGTWSDGPEATLLLKLDRSYMAPMELIVWCKPFVTTDHPVQIVQVLANDQPLTTWTLPGGDSSDEFHARIPAALTSTDDLKISFRMTNALSPLSIHASPDTRVLGIMLQKLRLGLISTEQ